MNKSPTILAKRKRVLLDLESFRINPTTSNPDSGFKPSILWVGCRTQVFSYIWKGDNSLALCSEEKARQQKWSPWYICALRWVVKQGEDSLSLAGSRVRPMLCM